MSMPGGESRPDSPGEESCNNTPIRKTHSCPTLSPWLIGFLVFILAPMAIALYLSFTRWDLFGVPQWIGLEN